MTSKKDDAINRILSDFEVFANTVLQQLDSLERIISSGETIIDKKVIDELMENEKTLDKMEVKISNKIVKTVVLYQPVASDIRKVFACFRIINNLERIGDMVINIVNYIQKIETQKIYTDLNKVITNMIISSSNMVKKALLAYTMGDKEFAIWTIKNDFVMNEFNKKIMNKAIKKSSQLVDNKHLLINFININSMVNNIERIADQATNIAEAAIYSIEGKDVRHKAIEDKY